VVLTSRDPAQAGRGTVSARGTACDRRRQNSPGGGRRGGAGRGNSARRHGMGHQHTRGATTGGSRRRAGTDGLGRTTAMRLVGPGSGPCT
jgi:hypothetical protein